MSYLAKTTFAIKTLGCKVNQYESQAMRESMARLGFIERPDNEPADIYIINSCTVTCKADKETRNLAHKFHSINPRGKIVIAGCYAETEADREVLSGIPGIAYLVRNSEKGIIAETLTSLRGNLAMTRAGLQPRFSRMEITDFKDRNRVFLKVQDGCNHRCSYCKVSLVRGPSQSRCAEEILKEARHLVEKGFKEIVLTGVCLGAWGKDLGDGRGLLDLIAKISRIDGRFRIRLSSIEPGYVTDKLIRVLRDEPKMCKHLHIPLQSGDDRILKLMNRPYAARRFAHIVKKVRRHIPDVAITTDVLVGFPGEDDRRFRNTLKFIKGIRPSRMHVFSYSRREGTAAAGHGNAPDKKAVKEHVKILTELSRQFSAEFAKSLIGKKEDTIIESHRDKATGCLVGYTGRYIRLLAEGADSVKNRLVSTRIIGADEGKNRVFGRLDNGEII